jgi:CRISPR-associated exonuclease Cas4
MTTPLPVLPVADADEYPPLSALNDLLFCPRRCALHRIEGVWVENAHTVAGSYEHRRVHTPRDADESPWRTSRGLWLTSHRLRLVGVADLVEFRRCEPGAPEVPYPVEYKRGRRRKWDNDEVQLCAQALCLEEMLGTAVPAGAIFSARSRRRREVAFDTSLRRQTEGAVARLHALLEAGVTPPPQLHPKCKQCSVRAVCMPEFVSATGAYRREAAALFTLPIDS